MKTFLRAGLTAMAVLLFFNVFAAVETKAQNPTNEILKRMETHRQSLTSLKADVTMGKYDSVLKVSDTTKGTVAYLPSTGKDAYVRIDWTVPANEILAVAKGKYVIYRPRLGQAIIGNANEAKGGGKANNALVFMNMSKSELKENYSIKYLGEEKVVGGFSTWHLELTPKKTQNFKSAEIWVDGNGMPLQAKIVENNNDTTTVLLSNLNKNTKINASVFKVDLPKGTKIING